MTLEQPKPIQMPVGQFLHDLFGTGELTVVMCASPHDLKDFLLKLARRGRVLRDYATTSPEAIHNSVHALRKEAVITYLPIAMGVCTEATTLERFPLSTAPYRVADRVMVLREDTVELLKNRRGTLHTVTIPAAL